MKGGGLVVNTANERWGVGYEYCQDVRGWNEGTEIQSCNAINDLKVVHTVVFCCCFVVFFCFFFSLTSCNHPQVIPLNKLQTNYKTFESKRQLSSVYDLYLTDKRLYHLLPRQLGKKFFEKKKFVNVFEYTNIQLVCNVFRRSFGMVLLLV